MNREESPKVHFGWTDEKRKDKLALIKHAVTEGSYKVKAEDIAEKLFKEWVFELALALQS